LNDEIKKNQQKPMWKDEIEKKNMISHHDCGKKLNKIFIKY
jgi:hypothetical protein